jgi:PAS domain S-box-containing protein
MLLLYGSLIPLFGNVLDTFGIVGGPINATPIGLALMGPFFISALVRYRLLDLSPVARRKLVETMSDPMMVIDSLGRIVDLNQAAQSIVNIPSKKVMGRAASEVLSRWPDLIRFYKKADAVKEEIGVEVNQDQRSYDLQISPLTDRQAGIAGSLIVLRDITVRKEAEQEREQLISELKKALSEVKTLSGLLPICASCKKIRDDRGYWNQLEAYFHEHSEVKFSHGICPECVQILYPDL